MVEHFGGQTKLAKALGIRQSSVATWGEIVPPLRQIQVERLTDGKFKASPDVFGAKKTEPGTQ